MNRFKLAAVVCGALLVGAIGCNKAQQEASAPGSQEHPAAASAQADNALSGKVIETMDAGGYTYVCLENSGTKTWVAVPQTKVTVGQQVTCEPGMEMKNFTSKTLKRTFPSIFFSGGIR